MVCEPHKPWVALDVAERRKPHLPVEPRLVWGAKCWRGRDISRLVVKMILFPVLFVVASFHHHLRAALSKLVVVRKQDAKRKKMGGPTTHPDTRHPPEQAITMHDLKIFDQRMPAFDRN